MKTHVNSYSSQWFKYFHESIPEERTNQEIAFIRANAPLPLFRRIADVCCGMGRHARALSALGYQVTGIERDAAAIDVARSLAGGPSYVCADVRNNPLEGSSVDAAFVMSQSFGYFGQEENRLVLSHLAGGLRDGGRILLDLWNPDFFRDRQGTRELKLSRGSVLETKHVSGDRLFVRLDYSDGGADDFEWQLFTPVQMASLANAVGLSLTVSCTDFDVNISAHADRPRIQFVLQKHR